MKVRQYMRYVVPKQGPLSYLHKKKKINIIFFLLSVFFWLQAILQTEIGMYAIFLYIMAFTFMSLGSKSLFLAIITSLSAMGTYADSQTYEYIALGCFSTILFFGSVFVIGGPKRGRHDGNGLYTDGDSSGFDGGGGGDV